MVRRLTELAQGAVEPESLAALASTPQPLLSNIAGDVLEGVMEALFQKGQEWNSSWEVFLTPRITKLIVPWDVKLFKQIGTNCRSLEMILVTTKELKFSPIQLRHLPRKLHTLDTDGDLFYEGRPLPSRKKDTQWLADVDFWIRSIKSEHTKPPPSSNYSGLSRLNLSGANVSSSDLVDLIRTYPNITFLRHYQLVTALCQLHMEAWRTAPGSLLSYKLRNIDADFSHVVRCRMSPKAVLPPEALRLAVTLCPQATSVRIRFDTSTPHHVVSYLTSLKLLNDFSAVCVSSGERVLLDFQDFMPVLDHFGSTSLKSLELKVVEEVDPHFVLRCCPRLQHLTLSGCGYTQNCRGPRCRPGPALPALITFFYADGDDFSWDHTLPQCFWASVFATGKKRASKLEGLFLESPRIAEETISTILGAEACFKNLKAICIRRSPEFNKERIADLIRTSASLEYLRVESFGPVAAAAVKRQHPKCYIKLD